MVFWCILCFFIGMFVGVVSMCLMTASKEYKYNEDEDPREDNNSFND